MSVDTDKPATLVRIDYYPTKSGLNTTEQDSSFDESSDIERGAKPVDIRDIINSAQEALFLDKDISWLIRRKQIRSSIRVIHRLLNPNLDSEQILLPHLAEEHVKLLSLLARLHTEYANLMTPKSDNGFVFIQYNDMAHAVPNDYPYATDSNYSKLQHFSRKEFADRSFAVKLACRLIDSGYKDTALEESIAMNEWIIGERTSEEDIWNNEAGQAWLRDVYSETHDVVNRYLPSDLYEESRDKLGRQAVTLAVKRAG